MERKKRNKRAFGVPATRGTLKVYRHGELIEEITPGQADAHARRVVRDTQGHGKYGRRM